MQEKDVIQPLKKKASIDEQPPIIRAAYRMLKSATRQLLYGECSEDEIAETLSTISKMESGYKREDDYVTIDEGMRILGFGQNRVGFCNLMKQHGIVNEKFNNVKIGYNKHKILALKSQMNDDYQKRRAKLDRKKRRRQIPIADDGE